MTDKIDLPSGGWAVLRDPDTVTERQRRPLVAMQRRLLGSDVGEILSTLEPTKGEDEKEAMKRLRPVIGSENFALLDDVSDLLIVALVSEWSYEAAVTVDGLLDLPHTDRAALQAACEPYIPRLTGQTPDEDVTDPASPTPPAAG